MKWQRHEHLSEAYLPRNPLVRYQRTSDGRLTDKGRDAMILTYFDRHRLQSTWQWSAQELSAHQQWLMGFKPPTEQRCPHTLELPLTKTD